MKLFAMKDGSDVDQEILAVLCCYEETRTFYIDIPESADPWAEPLILSSFAKRNQWTIGPEWSARWVESRIVPQSRQNLGEVLKANGLAYYDELRLLELSEGRNSQDDCYLDPIKLDDAPAWFREREEGRVKEAIPLDGWRLFVAVRSGGTYLCDVKALIGGNLAVKRVLQDEDVFGRIEVSPGGRGVSWGTSVEISDVQLRTAGQRLPLTWDDVTRIAPALLVNAHEAADMLECSRQNLNALTKRGSLTPAKASEKSTLFFRADVSQRRYRIVELADKS